MNELKYHMEEMPEDEWKKVYHIEVASSFSWDCVVALSKFFKVDPNFLESYKKALWNYYEIEDEERFEYDVDWLQVFKDLKDSCCCWGCGCLRIVSDTSEAWGGQVLICDKRFREGAGKSALAFRENEWISISTKEDA